MAKYISKSWIEAWQFKGFENAESLWIITEGACFYIPPEAPHIFRYEKEIDPNTTRPTQYAPGFLVLKVDGAGVVRVNMGEYIVKEPDGKFSKMTAKVFEEMFIPVT